MGGGAATHSVYPSFRMVPLSSVTPLDVVMRESSRGLGMARDPITRGGTLGNAYATRSRSLRDEGGLALASAPSGGLSLPSEV